MAFFDNSLLLSNAQAITTTAASTTVYDVTGAGAGNAPNQVFGQTSAGAASPAGLDIGTGDGIEALHAFFSIGVTGTGTGTITFQVQAAPPSGNNAGTYVTLAASAAYVGTTLIAGDVIDLPIPPFSSQANQIGPAMVLPRFYRLNYVVSGSATATVTAYIGTTPPLGYVSVQLPNNFVSV